MVVGGWLVVGVLVVGVVVVYHYHLLMDLAEDHQPRLCDLLYIAELI